jgi:hypothetical protein
MDILLLHHSAMSLIIPSSKEWYAINDLVLQDLVSE